MKSAANVVALLLDGGFESMDYSPEDLALYQQLRVQQQEMVSGNRVMDVQKGELSDEWTSNWHAFEQLRNKYNGMPPRQLQTEI